jgi:hypothetical protein
LNISERFPRFLPDPENRFIQFQSVSRPNALALLATFGTKNGTAARAIYLITATLIDRAASAYECAPAEGHFKERCRFKREANRALFIDTDILTTLIFSSPRSFVTRHL